MEFLRSTKEHRMPLPALTLPFLIKALVGAKLFAIPVNWCCSKTSASVRDSFLKHVDHVRESLAKAEVALEEDYTASLEQDLTTLRSSYESGWTRPEDSAAVLRTFKFLSWAHGRETVVGVREMTASHAQAAGTGLRNLGEKALARIFPKK